MFLTILFSFCLISVIHGYPSALCPKCDQNDYNPVCAEGRAYSSLCKLKREICLGRIVLQNWRYGRCTIVQAPPTSSRADDHDTRVIFRLI